MDPYDLVLNQVDAAHHEATARGRNDDWPGVHVDAVPLALYDALRDLLERGQLERVEVTKPSLTCPHEDVTHVYVRRPRREEV